MIGWDPERPHQRLTVALALPISFFTDIVEIVFPKLF